METPTLIERVEELIDSVENTRKELVLENKKRDKRIKWSRRLIYVLVLAMAIAIPVAILARNDARNARNDAHDARSALNAYIKANNDARTISCEQSNLVELNQETQEKKEWKNFFIAFEVADPSATPAIEAFLPVQNALIAEGHKLRDCSPAGITKYLTTLPKVK